MGTFGLGHDVVDVAAFAEQLSEPGSRMRSLFSVREVRQAADRARLKNDDEAVHLSAKWAGKEAFLKAWCDYLAMPPIRSRLIISRGLKSRSWMIPVVCRMCLWVRGRRQSSKLITRIRLPALAIPLLIPLLPITGLMQ